MEQVHCFEEHPLEGVRAHRPSPKELASENLKHRPLLNIVDA
jgi:hypothetical protein